MSPRYAYFGIGVVFLLALLAFINPNFMRGGHNRAGTTQPQTSMARSPFSIKSTAFETGASIPSKYTCDGTESSPPLTIVGTPDQAQSLALIVEDPDVPKEITPSGIFVHWIVFNIPASLTEITEDMQIGTMGANSAGKNVYAGPCPPRAQVPLEHRYIFTLYALDKKLSLKVGASKDEVLAAMKGHVVAEAQLIGRYKRK